MGIYTAEELKRMTGAKEIKSISSSTTPTPAPEKKGFLSRLGTGISEAFNKRDIASDQAFQQDQGLGSKLLQSAGQAAGFIGDVGAETIKAGFQSLPEGVQDVTKDVGVSILKTPVGQAGLDALQAGMESWDGFKQSNPEVAKNIESVVNIASILPVGAAAKYTVKGTMNAAEAGFDLAKTGATKAKEGIKRVVGTADLTPEQRLAKAIEDATPSYESLTPAKKAKVDLTKVEEGSFLEGRKLKPSKLQKQAGEEFASLPDYNPTATALEKFKLASREVKKLAIDLEDALDAEKIIVPKKEVAKRVNDALKKIPEESLLLRRSDPLIRSYYDVVRNGFKKIDGNTKGILDLRKILDKSYEKAGGKFAFGSDKMAALDDIHQKVRNELTKILIEKSNQEVASSLKRQWNLYRVADELKLKTAKESGSKLGRVAQKFPKVTKVLKSVGNLGGGIGVGTGINLAD